MDNTHHLIHKLRNKDNIAFSTLYEKYFNVAHAFIVNNNGTNDDALDVFQDSLLALVEKLEHDNFQLTASLKTYLMTIVRNIWFKKLRRIYRETSISDGNHELLIEEVEVPAEKGRSYLDRLKEYMGMISAHCNRLIRDIFFYSKPIEQIQEEYQYSSRHNAQNQKHKCVEQIRRAKEKNN